MSEQNKTEAEHSPLHGKTLEDLGVTSKRVLELHRARISTGAFEANVSGFAVPHLLGELARSHGRGFTLVSKPSGDGERVWVYARVNGDLDVAGHTAFGEPVTQGLAYDLYAVTRGPGQHADAVYTSRIGTIDRDGLFSPTKE